MKLSKRNLELVAQLEEQIEHHSLIIARMKANCQYLPSWFTEKPVAWYEGALAMCEGHLTSLLMKHNCYGGFNKFKVENKQFGVEYEVTRFYMTQATGGAVWTRKTN